MVTLLLGAASLPAHADLIGYWSLDGNADADAGGWGKSSVQSATNGYFPAIIGPDTIDATTRSFEFAHRRDATTFSPVISYSTDLAGFTAVSIPATTTTIAPGLEIVVTPNGVDAGIDQVSLRVDKTLFPRFFARLGVTIP